MDFIQAVLPGKDATSKHTSAINSVVANRIKVVLGLG